MYSKSEGGTCAGGDGGDGGEKSASPLGKVQVAHKNNNASRIFPLLPTNSNNLLSSNSVYVDGIGYPSLIHRLDGARAGGKITLYYRCISS